MNDKGEDAFIADGACNNGTFSRHVCWVYCIYRYRDNNINDFINNDSDFINNCNIECIDSQGE